MKNFRQKAIKNFLEYIGGSIKYINRVEVLKISNLENDISTQFLIQSHGNIINNDIVGAPFVWNKQETKFLYVADQKLNKGKFALEDEDGQDSFYFNKYNQDFGEQMQGIVNPKIYEYDLEYNQLSEIIIPQNVFPCYPQYCNDQGDKILFSGYQLYKHFNHGILHCFNRKSDIYISTNKIPINQMKETDCLENQSQWNIISEDYVSIMPKVSPDLKKMVYFYSNKNNTHLQYTGMKLIDLQNDRHAIESIFQYSNTYEKDEFMGMCGFFTEYNKSQWLNNSRHLILECFQQGSVVLYLCDTLTKKVNKITNVPFLHPHKFSILNYDAKQNMLISLYSTQCIPGIVKILPFDKILNSDLENVNDQWKSISLYQPTSILGQIQTYMEKNVEEKILDIDGIEGIYWKLKSPEQLQTSQNIPEIIQNLWKTSQYLNPLQHPQEKRPLIVRVHGGPNAPSLGEFSIDRLFFILSGCSVIDINYQGSAGYSQGFMDSLKQRNGDLDRKQILNFVQYLIDNNECDPSRIVCYGGSYGGYMCGNFASYDNDIFKCAALINPVLSFPFTYTSTDIPEYILGNIFNKQMEWNLTPEQYYELQKKSPMQEHAKIPVLLLLGQEDRRVPYKQSLFYGSQAKAHGTYVETYVYQKGSHSLSESPQIIFDWRFKLINFMDKHLNI